MEWSPDTFSPRQWTHSAARRRLHKWQPRSRSASWVFPPISRTPCCSWHRTPPPTSRGRPSSSTAAQPCPKVRSYWNPSTRASNSRIRAIGNPIIARTALSRPREQFAAVLRRALAAGARRGGVAVRRRRPALSRRLQQRAARRPLSPTSGGGIEPSGRNAEYPYALSRRECGGVCRAADVTVRPTALDGHVLLHRERGK